MCISIASCEKYPNASAAHKTRTWKTKIQLFSLERLVWQTLDITAGLTKSFACKHWTFRAQGSQTTRNEPKTAIRCNILEATCAVEKDLFFQEHCCLARSYLLPTKICQSCLQGKRRVRILFPVFFVLLFLSEWISLRSLRGSWRPDCGGEEGTKGAPLQNTPGGVGAACPSPCGSLARSDSMGILIRHTQLHCFSGQTWHPETTQLLRQATLNRLKKSLQNQCLRRFTLNRLLSTLDTAFSRPRLSYLGAIWPQLGPSCWMLLAIQSAAKLHTSPKTPPNSAIKDLSSAQYIV